MAAELSYRLEAFEGPLDLLLHLIEKEKINIYDIPIAKITGQYLAYVAAMDDDSLDIKSDFLVMAATLLDIKARMLLPPEKDPETGEEIDPRTELAERLIEYKRCKYMAAELAGLMTEAERSLYKLPTIPEEVAGYERPVDLDALLSGVDLKRLQAVFNEVMRKQDYRVDTGRSSFGTIKKEKISLEARVGALMQYAREHKHFSFRSLLEGSSDKVEKVVTFLAILELTKAGRLRISQEDKDGDVEIESADTDTEISGLEEYL